MSGHAYREVDRRTKTTEDEAELWIRGCYFYAQNKQPHLIIMIDFLKGAVNVDENNDVLAHVVIDRAWKRNASQMTKSMPLSNEPWINMQER